MACEPVSPEVVLKDGELIGDKKAAKGVMVFVRICKLVDSSDVNFFAVLFETVLDDVVRLVIDEEDRDAIVGELHAPKH